METTLLREIRRIQQLSVNELVEEWSRLYNGEACRSRNRPYLVKRLCWRLQERRLGGLSDRARARLEELGQTGFQRARTPDVAVPAPVVKPMRDLRLPSPGTVLTRQYHGREIRVVTLDAGFEFEGAVFASLSALAREITGSSHINGKLFFALVARKR